MVHLKRCQDGRRFFFFRFFVGSRACTLFLFSKGDCVPHCPPASLIPRHQIQHYSTCRTFAAQMAEMGLGALGCTNRSTCGKINLSFEVKKIDVSAGRERQGGWEPECGFHVCLSGQKVEVGQ